MLPTLHEMMKQLIATPSISSVNPDFDTSNAALCELLAGWLETAGFATRLMPVPGRQTKFNVIATRGNGPGGLVLAGHTDTVPYDAGRWNFDPFGALERDGRLYGLGSADMKSFFALALAAAQTFTDQPLAAPLTILATADEESSMSGARALSASGGPTGRYAVIGEPTGLRPVHAHKGIIMEAIRLRGQSAHSSDPARGVNAIDGMHAAIGALMKWRDSLARDHHDDRFAVPGPTLNFGAVRGGDNPNRVCAQCELSFDVRLVPGLDAVKAREGARRQVSDALAGSALEVEFDALFEGVNAYQCPEQSALLAACEQQTGHGRIAVGFGTEAPFLAALGLETVVIGPGDIAVAHQPDEYLPLDAIGPTLSLLRNLIARFCT